MRKNILIFISLVINIGLCCFFLFEGTENVTYYKTKVPYCIENIGVLSPGTIIKLEDGMSESYTRYSILLNVSDIEELDIYETSKVNMNIPYWLRPLDSIYCDFSELFPPR
jgi:hypothetical protein